jgi:putative transposase
MIETVHPSLSVVRQCELLGLPRSSFYYAPVAESAENLRLMRRLDELYTAHPFYGSRRMVAALEREGWELNRKRVQRLMQVMGLEALYPKRSLSAPASPEARFPYLLKGLAITRPNQVWAVDITYIRLAAGYLYLVALLDWFSRYVLAWELSNSLEVGFCLRALERALRHGAPAIHNSDQGVQFTSAEYVAQVQASGARISWDGRGRVYDNIFVERLWRSVKYEEIYLREYADGWALQEGLAQYFRFYNEERPHQALAYRTPAEVYHGDN